MDAASDIHSTARTFFLVKIANGAVPDVVTSGELDGLRYFAAGMDGEDYRLTEHGLLGPPLREPHLGHGCSEPRSAKPADAAHSGKDQEAR